MNSIDKNNNSSLLERRQQTSAVYLEPLELPSLQDAATAALAASSAATSSMITSTTQSLIQPPIITSSNVINNSSLLQPPTVVSSTNIYSSVNNHPSSLNQNSLPPLPPLDPTLLNISTINPMLSTNIQPQFIERPRQSSISSQSSLDNKKYSFVTLPGTTQKKRPRRRYDEIERLYHCTWPGCTKSYGTLNHLNAHVSMQQHGPKRHPSEFKEMRKEWRRQKKSREAAKKSADMAIQQQQQQQQQHHHHQHQHHSLFQTMPTPAVSLAIQPLNNHIPFY